MFWLPTIAPHITVVEAVRLAGKGFSASNHQMSFGSFPLELDDIIIIFLGHPLLFLYCRTFFMAYTLGNNENPLILAQSHH